MAGDDLVGETDPLIAEMWASRMLGTFYKLQLPVHVRDELEGAMEAHLLEAIDDVTDEGQLHVLRALAAVAPEPVGARARAKAGELSAQDAPEPPWADRIGHAEFLDAWVTEDPFGDQRLYVARSRYPGHDAHHITCLYDVNLGGIVKDAFVGYTKRDLREVPAGEETSRREIEPHSMASEVLAGIGTGDMYLDNDWTDGFKDARALLISRMRALIDEPPRVPLELDPISEQERQILVHEYLVSQHATGLDAEDSILDHALDFRCDYSDGDPIRWSPIGVELFMLDFLPRKVALDATEIRNLPNVLKAWVRFGLEKRGLDERWIKETVTTVDRWAADFRQEVTDPDSFGPVKAIGQAMAADGVALTDRAAVERWMEEFNRRPFEERDEFFRNR